MAAKVQHCTIDSELKTDAEKSRLSQWPEVMVITPGLSSGIVYYVMKELKDAGRLKVHNPLTI